jgi:Domain of unknown function (DUF4389)
MINTIEPQIGAGNGSIRPSRRWYLLAGCLLAVAAACLAIAVTGIVSWDRQIQDFQRVPVPGRGEVTFTQPGDYVLYVETRGTCCSWAFGGQGGSWAAGDQGMPLARWSMRLAMGPVDGPRPIPVSDWHGLPESYGVSGHQGLTGMSVTITHPGTYLIETSDVHPAAVTDLAVGRSILRATLLPLVPIVAGLAALGGAVLLFVLTAARRRRARRGPEQPPGETDPVPWPSPGDAPAVSGPVLVQFAGPRRQHRATVLFRAILAIPVLICLYFARYVAWLVLVTGWFGALVTGRLPGYAASFLAGFQRWEVGTYAYLLLLTDRHPFGSLDADYPVSVTLSPGRLNRAAVFFRMVLIIPASLVAAILMYGLGPILMIPTWLIVLIGGRMPQPLYQAIAASVRYWARMKAYWYLLTDVYPAGLFGDGPEPAPGLCGPVAAGSALTGQEPTQPVPLPAEYQVLLPAAYVAPAAASPAPGVPGRLVLSRPAKRLVGLTLGIGAVTPLALFTMVFAAANVAPPVGPAPGSVAAAAGGSTGPASTAPAPSASAAPSSAAPSSAAPALPHRTARWLNGLSSLSEDMTGAMGANNQVVTNVSLRSSARRLSRCSARLSALGPPTAQVRQVDRLAARACQGFEQGARYYAAAARFIGPDGSATDQGKVTRLLGRGDAGVNRGANIMSNAVADGSFIGPPG